ncbi:glycosyltransferase family 4 protein [Neolewinella persica]|uniref:glycosyltransferase family 4 protein n=1 Tax=Neolewinella persica TaxID=70998 RepID=UPI00035F09DC|nr:glycosyltransferase family 4 protein [Neolewinella persica]
MKAPIVLISIFRETVIGGIAVHSSNLFERMKEEGLPVEKVNFAEIFVRPGILSKLRMVFKVGGRLMSLRLSGARLFHFHASNRAVLFYLYAPLVALTGARIMLSLHSGYGYDRWLGENRAYHLANQVFFRLLDKLIFMNPDESDKIRARYPFLQDKVVTINPFIAPPKAAIPALDISSPNPKKFKIATIGVWMQRYNVEEAIQAAVRFNATTGAPVLMTVLLSTVIIEPAYREKLEAIIARARETIDVVVLEDQNNILDVLVRQDLFIRASMLDSYGLCVAESLLVGTPVIATDVCRRCTHARLYRQGDEMALDHQVLEVWDARHTPRKRMLAEEEDSFYGYLKAYEALN